MIQVCIFEGDAQFLLVYAPSEGTVELPALHAPFDISEVKAACSERKDLHVVRDFVTKTLRNIFQQRAKVEGARRKKEDLDRQAVEIFISKFSEHEWARDRGKLIERRLKVDCQLREAKNRLRNARRDAAESGRFLSKRAYAQLQGEIGRLAQESQALLAQISKLKREAHEKAEEKRERLFIQAARQTLSKEVYLDLWEQVDLMESEDA